VPASAAGSASVCRTIGTVELVPHVWNDSAEDRTAWDLARAEVEEDAVGWMV